MGADTRFAYIRYTRARVRRLAAVVAVVAVVAVTVHAKFVFVENRHYFLHFQHNGFRDAPFARNYCAYKGA